MDVATPLSDEDYPRFDSVTDFLRWTLEQPGEERYELDSGRVFRCQSERVIHAVVKGNVHRSLGDALNAAKRPCRAYPDGMTVPIPGSVGAYIPDALVQCGEPPDDEAVAISDPVILVEVVSPSTVRLDTQEKYAGYFSTPSVMHYLIVHPLRRYVVHHRRAGEIIEARIHGTGEGVLTLDPPGMTLDIAGFFPAKEEET